MRVEVRLRHRGEVETSCGEMKIMKMPFYVYTGSDDGSRSKSETVENVWVVNGM